MHCKNPKSDHPVSGGAVKKAGDGEASKLSKAAKKRQVKLRKKAKEELKKKEAEAAKRAFLTYQGSGSSAEEESPKKLSARQAKVGGLAGRSLYIVVAIYHRIAFFWNSIFFNQKFFWTSNFFETKFFGNTA